MSHWIKTPVGAVALLVAFSLPGTAQWLEHPTPGTPRTVDGAPDLDSPTPRLPDGSVDLSGVWVAVTPRYIGDLSGGQDVPFQPWAEELYEERRANLGRDDPEAQCLPQGVPKVNTLPYPFKIFNTPDAVVILYEMYYLHRQVFTDGRELPSEYIAPAWMGYSIGEWAGDEFVVTTSGFNDKMWMDTNGHPHTDQLVVTERFRRLNFGRMEIEVTIDDPGAYTAPWGVTMSHELLADTELLEFVCEKNIDPEHLVGPG
jgi:hypothetical protein